MMAETKASPTQLTLAQCRRLGWHADVAEYWVPSHSTRAIISAAYLWYESATKERMRELRKAIGYGLRGSPGKRRDLFGMIDIVALDNETGDTVGIQACMQSSKGARVEKILLERPEQAIQWLGGKRRLEVWSWRKYKEAVNRRLWRETVTPITMEDLI